LLEYRRRLLAHGAILASVERMRARRSGREPKNTSGEVVARSDRVLVAA
jgi:hypothetical protein